MIKVVWKNIPSCPGYQASSDGRVRSIDREVTSKNGVVKILKGKVLKPHYGPNSPYGNFRAGKKQGKVHLAVCEAFHGRKPSKIHQVCHKDGDCSNNTSKNLYWGTPKENQADRFKHGNGCAGEQHHQARVSEKDVATIKALALNGVKQKVIGVRFGITQSQVSMIVNGKRWSSAKN